MIKYHRQFKKATSTLSRYNKRRKSEIASSWGKSCQWKRQNSRGRNRRKAIILSRPKNAWNQLPKNWKQLLLCGKQKLDLVIY